MELKNSDTPRPMFDLNEERGKASFHPRALTYVLEGGEAKTQRREYFERLVEEVNGGEWWSVSVSSVTARTRRAAEGSRCGYGRRSRSNANRHPPRARAEDPHPHPVNSCMVVLAARP